MYIYMHVYIYIYAHIIYVVIHGYISFPATLVNLYSHVILYYVNNIIFFKYCYTFIQQINRNVVSYLLTIQMFSLKHILSPA